MSEKLETAGWAAELVRNAEARRKAYLAGKSTRQAVEQAIDAKNGKPYGRRSGRKSATKPCRRS